MNFRINEHVSLSNECPTSRYGAPVLCWWNGREYGPSDIPESPPETDGLIDGADVLTAADYVYSWGMKAERTTAERKAARDFCVQWPEGPQIAE